MEVNPHNLFQIGSIFQLFLEAILTGLLGSESLCIALCGAFGSAVSPEARALRERQRKDLTFELGCEEFKQFQTLLFVQIGGSLLVLRALLFGVYIRASVFWRLPQGAVLNYGLLVTSCYATKAHVCINLDYSFCPSTHNIEPNTTPSRTTQPAQVSSG